MYIDELGNKTAVDPSLTGELRQSSYVTFSEEDRDLLEQN